MKVIGLESKTVTVGNLSPNVERVVAIVAQRLLKDWFPSKLPVDLYEWTEIAMKDATSVVQELIDQGFIKVEGVEPK
jgi:hypothetical protein